VPAAIMSEQVDTKLEEKLEAVADFLSYEEYLDSQILPLDEYFLEDKELARELVQLGYRGGSQADTISREEFAQLKRIQNDKKAFQKEAPKLLVRCACAHRLGAAPRRDAVRVDPPLLACLHARPLTN
jgi:hypothetical protein